jgi:iron complex outermembrane recepter protein
VNVADDFRKEVSSAFEVGIKGRAFDRRLNFDLAAYYTDVDDSQQFQFFVGPFGVLRVIENIDSVRIQGIEGSVDFRVVRGWTLSASANYLDSEIRRNSTRPNTVGNQSPNTPEYTLNFGSQIDADLSSSVRLVSRTDVRVTGPTYFSTVQDQDVPNIFPFGPGNFSNSRRDAYTVVNTSLAVEFSSLTITAFAANLFNQEFIKEGIVTPEFGGSFISPGDRRSYGIELGYKF